MSKRRRAQRDAGGLRRFSGRLVSRPGAESRCAGACGVRAGVRLPHAGVREAVPDPAAPSSDCFRTRVDGSWPTRRRFGRVRGPGWSGHGPGRGCRAWGPYAGLGGACGIGWARTWSGWGVRGRGWGGAGSVGPHGAGVGRAGAGRSVCGLGGARGIGWRAVRGLGGVGVARVGALGPGGRTRLGRGVRDQVGPHVAPVGCARLGTRTSPPVTPVRSPRGAARRRPACRWPPTCPGRRAAGPRGAGGRWSRRGPRTSAPAGACWRQRANCR